MGKEPNVGRLCMNRGLAGLGWVGGFFCFFGRR